MQRTSSPKFFSVSTQPLEQVIIDMENLMRSCNDLGAELNACREEADVKMKKMLLSFIEVSDAFERVLQGIEPRLANADPQAKKWAGNFRTVYRLLQRTLNRHHITPIEVSPGETANPFWHNIVETTFDENAENGTIAEITKKGYMLQGKLLRAVDVVAVKKPQV